MSNTKKWIKSILWGLLWAAIPGAVAWLLLRYCSDLTLWIGGRFGLDEMTVGQVSEAMVQLKTAVIHLPWAVLLGAGVGWGCLRRAVMDSPGGRRLLTVLGVLLLLPGAVGVLWLTKINGIRLGALLESFLPMLKGVL